MLVQHDFQFDITTEWAFLKTDKAHSIMGEERLTDKIQTLKPDTVLKNYWRNKEQFADFFNAVLFDGKNVIRPEELENMDTDESTVLEHREHAESISAARDLVRVRKRSTASGTEFVILGEENQEHIHYAMPMRIMGYDYNTYRKQYEDNAAKYKSPKRNAQENVSDGKETNAANGMTEDEFLSKMRKTDRFIPVITIVVYYGEKPWDGPFSLHDMLQVSEEMQPFVSDYKMHLVEARKNDLKLHNINNRDLFQLLGILLNKSEKRSETKKKAMDYAKEHHVRKEVILTVAGTTNCKMDYRMLEEKGETSMISVFQETWDEGKVEGQAETIVEMGYEFGLSEEDILTRLQNKLNIPLQKAEEYLKMFGKQPA